MLPDGLTLLGQNLIEIAKILKFILDNFGNFQTMYNGQKVLPEKSIGGK